MSDGNESGGYGLSEEGADGLLEAPTLEYLPRRPKTYRPKIGLIGCGGIAAYHLEAYRTLGLDVVALCDVDEGRAVERRDAYYPEAKIFTDYRELFARDDIGVIDTATHPEERVGIVEASLLAGKHVLSQKPFVRNLDEGARLVQLAEEKGLKLAVNQNGRWAPHFGYMARAIEAGLIGEVGSADFSLQWDHTWIEDTPFDEIHHLILYDFAIHWFDICTAFFGEREATSVNARVNRAPGQRTKPPMMAQVLIDYGDAQATMSFNGHVAHGQRDETVVCGSMGTLRSAGPSLSEQSVEVFTEAGRARPDLEGTWFENGFQGTMGELLCAIEEDREPLNSARGNLKSLALCFAAMASADEGGVGKKPGEVRCG